MFHDYLISTEVSDSAGMRKQGIDEQQGDILEHSDHINVDWEFEK